MMAVLFFNKIMLDCILQQLPSAPIALLDTWHESHRTLMESCSKWVEQFSSKFKNSAWTGGNIRRHQCPSRQSPYPLHVCEMPNHCWHQRRSYPLLICCAFKIIEININSLRQRYGFLTSTKSPFAFLFVAQYTSVIFNKKNKTHTRVDLKIRDFIATELIPSYPYTYHYKQCNIHAFAKMAKNVVMFRSIY